MKEKKEKMSQKQNMVLNKLKKVSLPKTEEE
jgi:hypothetical protein